MTNISKRKIVIIFTCFGIILNMILLSPQIAKYQIGNILNSIYWILCIVLISILFRRQHINKYFIYIFMLSSIYNYFTY